MVRIVYSKIKHIFNKEILGTYIQAFMKLNIFLLTYTIYLLRTQSIKA